MTNTDWNSSSPSGYKTKCFHPVILKPVVGTEQLRGEYGNVWPWVWCQFDTNALALPPFLGVGQCLYISPVNHFDEKE